MKIKDRRQKTAEVGLGLQAATANLYWRVGTGTLRRIFAMNENGRFRIWLHYVLGEGREDVAPTIRELSKPVVAIAAGKTMKYLPRDVAFGKMRAMVEGAKIVRREIGGLN